MNGGSNKGQAYGFKLTSMPRLITTKSTDGKSNLLQYVIHVLRHLNPALLSFVDELPHIKEAATMEQGFVELELMRFKESCRQLSAELLSERSIQSEDAVPDQFVAVMQEFCEDTARESEKLTIWHTQILSQLDKALKYFALPAPMHWEQLFRLVNEFIVNFKKEAQIHHKPLEHLTEPRPRGSSLMTSLPEHVKNHQHTHNNDEDEEWEAPGAGRKKLAHQVMGTLRKGSSAKLTAVMTKRRLHLEGMSTRTMKQAGLQFPGSPRGIQSPQHK